MLLPASSPGQTPPPTVRAHRVAAPIHLDGRLDEAVYAATPAITNFVQQKPDEFKPATEKTESWIFFDDDNIYVSARCFESHPERRVANEMRRDTTQLRQNDTFAVLFDTFHDKRNGYIFYANAIGGLADGQITDEGPPNNDWNTVWDVKTGTFDGGWTIEMAIPFKSLRYQPGTDQTWGINLRRVVRWKNEWSYLAQVPRALTTFRGILKISSAGTLEGLQVPSGSRNLEVKPYALAALQPEADVDPQPAPALGRRQPQLPDQHPGPARYPRGGGTVSGRADHQRRRQQAATSASAGSISLAASYSSSTRTTTIRIPGPTPCRFATARWS